MNNQKFPWKSTFLLGFGFLGISLIWPIFNQYIPIFLQAGNPEFNQQLLAEGKTIPNIMGFGLAPALAMFVMTWDNIINVFLQPWVGSRSDRTWNRFGRRKPWILLGMPIAALGFIFVPVAQSVLAVMVFVLITDIGMALFRSPTIAWLGDLFKPADRSKANGVINLMGGVGGLLAYFVGGILFDKVGRTAPFIAGAVAMIAALIIAIIFVKEPRQILANVDAPKEAGVLANFKAVLANKDRSGFYVLLAILLWFIAYNALETGLSSFAVFTLGMQPGTASIYASAVTVSFIVFSVPAGLIANRIGRKRTIQIGLLVLAVLLFGGYFLVRSATTFIVALILVGFFWAMVNVNSLPLVYDHGDESKIGAYTGLYYFSSQSAAVIGPVMGGLVVQLLGSQYRWLWLFSTLFMFLAWLAMRGVKEGLKIKEEAPAIQPAAE